VLADQPMTQVDAWRMVRKRARRRHHGADPQPFIPRDRNHGVIWPMAAH
jgi:hypothetical protein